MQLKELIPIYELYKNNLVTTFFMNLETAVVLDRVSMALNGHTGFLKKTPYFIRHQEEFLEISFRAEYHELYKEKKAEVGLSMAALDLIVHIFHNNHPSEEFLSFELLDLHSESPMDSVEMILEAMPHFDPPITLSRLLKLLWKDDEEDFSMEYLKSAIRYLNY